LLSTTGCASLFGGTHQSIAVSSTPPQASCALTRDGAVIGKVESTPGSVDIRKGNKDIAVSCEKPGYQIGRAQDEADLDAWFIGNAVIGGLLGIGIDYATGAINKYDGQVTVALQPAGGAVPQVSVLPPPSIGAPEAPVALAPPAAPSVAYQPPSRPVVQTAVYEASVQQPALAVGSHRVFGVGVLPVDPSSAAAQTLGLDFGMRVMIVQEGSIAAKSGIRPGDILVSLDGEPINQKGDVQRIVASRADGAIVSIDLVRNGAPMDLATQL